MEEYKRLVRAVYDMGYNSGRLSASAQIADYMISGQTLSPAEQVELTRRDSRAYMSSLEQALLSLSELPKESQEDFLGCVTSLHESRRAK